jgi:uncharacterized protein
MKCPTCKKPIEWKDNPYRPFCSERCKLVDLGRWVNDEYSVPGEQVSEPAESPSAPAASSKED